MSEVSEISGSFGDRNNELTCPSGTATQLRLVKQKPVLVECILGESVHRCPNSVSFGNGSYCFTLLLRALAKGYVATE